MLASVCLGLATCWLASGALAAAPASRAAAAAGEASAPRATGPEKPEFREIKQAVADYFARQNDHQPGDIICQSQVRALLADLQRLGWKPADAEEILAKVPGDAEPLVRVLKTRDGKKLIRKTADYSLVYDRLDRTSQLPGGPALLQSLPKLPDGAKYLQTRPTPGFKNLAQLLPKQANGKSPRGVDFDKPTGRIYTVAQLMSALEQSYQSGEKQ